MFEKQVHYVVSFVLQARATLIHILELQIQRRKQAVEDIKRYDFLKTFPIPPINETE